MRERVSATEYGLTLVTEIPEKKKTPLPRPSRDAEAFSEGASHAKADPMLPGGVGGMDY